METRATMLIRKITASMLAFLLVNALGGGVYGILGAEHVPVEWLAGTPFQNYFIPSLILLVVVGGSCFIGVYSLLA